MTALAATSLIVGAAISSTNVPGLVVPDKFAAWLRNFPRHRRIGCILMLIDAIWTAVVIFTGQYGDFWIFPEKMIRYSVLVLVDRKSVV